MRLLVRALRDVTMIDGSAEPAQDERAKDAFAAKHGWPCATRPATTHNSASSLTGSKLGVKSTNCLAAHLMRHRRARRASRRGACCRRAAGHCR
jgi:hypothetical protein